MFSVPAAIRRAVVVMILKVHDEFLRAGYINGSLQSPITQGNAWFERSGEIYVNNGFCRGITYVTNAGAQRCVGQFSVDDSTSLPGVVSATINNYGSTGNWAVVSILFGWTNQTNYWFAQGNPAASEVQINQVVSDTVINRASAAQIINTAQTTVSLTKADTGVLSFFGWGKSISYTGTTTLSTIGLIFTKSGTPPADGRCYDFKYEAP